MIQKIKIVIDTDPGIDDAFAITAALHHNLLDVQLITTVGGNVSVDKTTKNALKLLEFFNKDIPVAKGIGKPLIKVLEDAANIHGESGLDGYDFPEPTRQPIQANAVEALRNLLQNSDDKITLVPIAPLTNIAVLFTLYPELKNKIDRIVLMGGSASVGNQTPTAEYNIFTDPEAAKIVFHSGVDLVMVGLDVTSIATLSPDMITQMESLNQTSRMLHSLFKHYRGGSLKTGLKMHDLCAIAYLVKPELFTTVKTFVDIETQGSYTAGTTVVDIKNRYQQPPNATVCMGIDVEGFRTWVMEQLYKMQ